MKDIKNVVDIVDVMNFDDKKSQTARKKNRKKMYDKKYKIKFTARRCTNREYSFHRKGPDGRASQET